MRINIKNLRVNTVIGFYPEEREKKQYVLINISFEASVGESISTDDVVDTVDYKPLIERVTNEVTATEFHLLEKLADFVLKLVMEQDERISFAEVEIDKPDAPVPGIDSVSVTTSARRG